MASPQLTVTLTALLFTFLMALSSFRVRDLEYSISQKVTDWESVGPSSSQGHIFRPKRMRSFEAGRLFCNDCSRNRVDFKTPLPSYHNKSCDKWAVLTTIFEPTRLAHQLANLRHWCVVVVGDLNGVKNYTMSGVRNQVVFLDPDTQSKLGYKILKHLQWNHFSRKNVGYLYAIHHGASIIYDTDDDNILEFEDIPLARLISVDSKIPFKLQHSSQPTYNPYIEFKMRTVTNETTFSWPRGLPLEVLRDPQTFLVLDDVKHPSPSDIGVIQSLANHEPDVDSIFRLTKELPVTFSRKEAARALPQGMMMPFNAQATLFLTSSLWATLLPATVHGRVSDIWRSYIAQRLMWDIDQTVVVSSPFVKQYRNAHNYMADFNAEQDLFSKAGELIKYLLQWSPTSVTLPGCMEELIISLYEFGFLEKSDIFLWQAWVEDLLRIGYAFPSINSSELFQPTEVTFDQMVSHSMQTTEFSTRSGRVAVCVSGQPRSLNMDVDDVNYPKSWEPMMCNTSDPVLSGPVHRSIQKNLFDSLEKIGFDVFMYVSTTGEGPRSPNIGEDAVCAQLQPRNTSNQLKCVVEEEVAWPWKEPILDHYFYPHERGIAGLHQQLYGMYKCNEMRKQYTAETGVEYDYIIRLRPDTVFLDPFPDLDDLDFGNGDDDSKSSRVLFADKAACCCGNEDWFGIGRTQVMDIYLDRLLYLPLRDLKGWNLNDGWTAEEYLARFLQRYAHADLFPDPRIKACLVKPLDRQNIGDPRF